MKIKWSKYNYIYESPQYGTLLFNRLSGAFFDISDPDTRADVMRIKEDPEYYDFSEDSNNYKMFISAGVLCEDDEDNKNVMIYRTLSRRFHPNYQSLTILPTLDCNLSCSYCFEASHRQSGRMSLEVIKKLKEYINEQCHQKNHTLRTELVWRRAIVGV